MRLRYPPVVVLGLLALGSLCPAALSAQQPQRGVTLPQFQQLRWLQGYWRGSGGAYPAFYEQYLAVDDSTVQMRAFSDSTFSVATDSSRIELRSGTVTSRRPHRASVALEVRPDRIHFVPEGATGAGFTFSRVSENEWTATLHAAAAGGRETVYVMRRISR